MKFLQVATAEVKRHFVKKLKHFIKFWRNASAMNLNLDVAKFYNAIYICADIIILFKSGIYFKRFRLDFGAYFWEVDLRSS